MTIPVHKEITCAWSLMSSYPPCKGCWPTSRQVVLGFRLTSRPVPVAHVLQVVGGRLPVVLVLNQQTSIPSPRGCRERYFHISFLAECPFRASRVTCANPVGACTRCSPRVPPAPPHVLDPLQAVDEHVGGSDLPVTHRLPRRLGADQGQGQRVGSADRQALIRHRRSMCCGCCSR